MPGGGYIRLGFCGKPARSCCPLTDSFHASSHDTSYFDGVDMSSARNRNIFDDFDADSDSGSGDNSDSSFGPVDGEQNQRVRADFDGGSDSDGDSFVGKNAADLNASIGTDSGSDSGSQHQSTRTRW